MLQTFLHILRHEGFLALYSGLSASLLRQATYSTTRFGAYEELKSRTPANPGFGTLLLLSSTSGVLGGLAGNPADVINVRMQQDRSLPQAQQRGYKNAIDGLAKMVRSEGALSLFRGVGPNCVRAALMTSAQLATYDKAKQGLVGRLGMQDGVLVHICASGISGLVATTVCSPVDVVKTRVMGSHDGKGVVHALRDIVGREGVRWVFRGWLPSFVRLGPHTVLTFVALEQHKKVWRWFKAERT